MPHNRLNIVNNSVISLVTYVLYCTHHCLHIVNRINGLEALLLISMYLFVKVYCGQFSCTNITLVLLFKSARLKCFHVERRNCS